MRANFPGMGKGIRVVVAIPVRNEECCLPACLAALSSQTRPADAILLLLNNCDDGSLEISQRARAQFSRIHRIHIVEQHLNEAQASAGEARRRAFEHALPLAGDGVILTTDADTVVPETWIADNLTELENGADCVCGMAIIRHETDSVHRPRLAFDDMRERLLLSLQDEIAALVDPDPYDPWPRHQQHSGASIAVAAPMLRRAGGAPRVATGEDRALVARLAQYDARIRHAPHIQVTVSGRLKGRAAGGMAETIMRRLNQPDWWTDGTLEPTQNAYRRALTRARLRAAGQHALHHELMTNDFANELKLDPRILIAALRGRYFGLAWDQIQQASPVLRRQRIAFAELARETRQALALRDELCRGMATPTPVLAAQ